MGQMERAGSRKPPEVVPFYPAANTRMSLPGIPRSDVDFDARHVSLLALH